ncbi:MAG: gamma-glutamylcyclotransferase family protein [Trichloromonadaceae bacterium]
MTCVPDQAPASPPLPVFVYGTLRPGEENYPHFLAGRTAAELPGTVAGELFFVVDGGYPYLAPGKGRVHGELVELDPHCYRATLESLDALEEYHPQDERHSVYLRRTTHVRLADGSERPAWVYYWNVPTRRGVKITSGDFRQHQQRS